VVAAAGDGRRRRAGAVADANAANGGSLAEEEAAAAMVAWSNKPSAVAAAELVAVVVASDAEAQTRREKYGISRTSNILKRTILVILPLAMEASAAVAATFAVAAATVVPVAKVLLLLDQPLGSCKFAAAAAGSVFVVVVADIGTVVAAVVVAAIAVVDVFVVAVGSPLIAAGLAVVVAHGFVAAATVDAQPALLEAFAAASFPGATAAAVVAAEAAACAATVLSRPWEWTAGPPSSHHRKPSASMAHPVVPIGWPEAVMGRQSVGAEFRHIPVAAAAVVASEMETRIWNGQQRTTVVVVVDVVDDLCLAKSWEVIIVKLYSFLTF
jgi:hypothetical protein